MRVGFDIDGVLYPFLDALKTYLGRPDLPTPTSWGFSKTWGEEIDFEEACEAAAHAGALFSADPLPGVGAALERVKRAGHEVVLVSARYHGPDPLGQTLSWVSQHSLPVDSVLLTRFKEAAPVDCLLDDRVSTLEVVDRHGIDAYALLTPWGTNALLNLPSYSGIRVVRTVDHYVDAILDRSPKFQGVSNG